MIHYGDITQIRGGFLLVYQRAGVKPVWASEIEEFPIAVTKKRFGGDEENV